MKLNLAKLLLLSSSLCLLLLLPSCRDEEEITPSLPNEDTLPVETRKVNQFIEEYVQDAYLWTATIDWTAIEPLKEPDSYAFFKKLMYKDDRWSLLTDNLKGLTEEVSGISTTFGYRLIFGRFIDSDDRFAIVLYVYPGTPAEEAGLKRGDILISINGGAITEANMMELYDAASLLIGRGILTDEGVAADPQWVYMEARNMYENPIVKDTVIVNNGHTIGYLCYTDYTAESEQQLQEVFAGFKSKNATDVVLDLRYNGGGFARTSVLLSSILAPQTAVRNKEIFLTQVWNDAYTAQFAKEKRDVNEYFTDTLQVNMNLRRLFVLTTENTASASEATIVGLTPYMEVITIGDTTHGKYCGGALLSPQIWNSSRNEWVVDEEIENWGMYLMLYRFANRNGVSSFTGGLAPDVYAEEDYFMLYPFGDTRDPLLGEALAMITGLQLHSSRSGVPSPQRYELTKAPQRRGIPDGKMIDTRPVPKRGTNNP
ncbi:MAG: PDZ domain-containing protein [Dysgonamonadaceae bacterium]|jgi:C-terminal processing protease CtpA/Prc|nr:PDZ domain-containing protein [Dysgonamonadaceae bacterium]